MKKYEHYSFDLWQTLIKGNPNFKKLRAKLFEKHYNPEGCDADYIYGIIRQVDVECNLVNEAVGRSINALEMYTMVLSRIGHVDITYDLLEEVYRKTTALFVDYHPTIYSGETIEVLKFLKKYDKLVSVLSNTGFIGGASLQFVFRELGIGEYIDKAFFSDIVEFSKPNPRFFAFARSGMGISKKVKKEETLHVGDNPIADYKGAIDYGYDALLINGDTDKTIKDVLWH